MLKYKFIDSVDALDRIAQALLRASPPIIGFDTESTVTPNGTIGSLGLLQLAVPGDHGGVVLDGYPEQLGETTVFLISMGEIRSNSNFLPKSFEKLLLSYKIRKVGCNITQDAILVRKAIGVFLNGTIDLQLIAESIGIVPASLDRLGGLLLGIPKENIDLLTANWDGELTEQQVKYAVIDAVLSLRCYLALFKPVPEIVPPPTEDDEAVTLELWEFLKTNSVFNGKRKPTVESVERVVVNGFPRWTIVYRPDQRVQLFREHLSKLVDQRRLYHDQFTDELSLSEPQKRFKIEIKEQQGSEQVKKILRHLSVNQAGIPKPSLVKVIVSSFINEQPADERESYAISLIEKLINEQLVEVRGERIHYLPPAAKTTIVQ